MPEQQASPYLVYQLGLLVGAGFGAVCAYSSYGYFKQYS